jgi:hypothetical protein
VHPIPNESRPEDRAAIHPSLPQRPSPPYLTVFQGLVYNPVYLNMDFLVLCRVDITIPKLIEVNFVVLPESC